MLFGQSIFAQAPQYDLLIQGGHVLDFKNKIDGIRDVAVKDGKIAAVRGAYRYGYRPEDRECEGALCESRIN